MEWDGKTQTRGVEREGEKGGGGGGGWEAWITMSD